MTFGYVFITILFLFAVGATIGWCLEVVGRSFRAKKPINPGFLSGPALPIYGFGTVALHYLSNMQPSFIKSDAWQVVFFVALVMVIMTVFEFVGGLIFIKGMGLKLWDYSNKKGNILGIICPQFTLLWGIFGLGYYYLINPWLKLGADWATGNTIFILFLGVYYGVLLVDLAYSMNVGLKLRKLREKLNTKVINWQDMKQKALLSFDLGGKRRPYFTLIAKLEKYASQLKDKDDDN